MVETEHFYFEKIELRRGENYFVTYIPPLKGYGFAILQLTFLHATEEKVVSRTLESELRYWLERYPVCAMASAFDDTDSVISLGDGSIDHHLVGWVDPDSGGIVLSWKLGELTKFSKLHPLPPDLRDIYHDVSYRTELQRQADIDKKSSVTRRGVRLLRGFSILWFVAVPVGVALFEYFGPEWLGTIVLLYAFWQGLQEWRKITGRKKQSAREKDESEKKLRMEHYYYHCEQNPTGFSRLKVENFEAEARARTLSEAEKLKTLPPS